MMRWLALYQQKVKARAKAKDDSDLSWELEDLEHIWERPLR